MNYGLYMTYDSLQGFIGVAYLFKNDDMARRGLSDSIFAGAPNETEKDLTVYRVADINLDNGIVTPVDKVMVLEGTHIHTKKLEALRHEN